MVTGTNKRYHTPERWDYARRPPQGLWVTHTSELDDLVDYVSDDITFQKVKNLTRAVDSGDLSNTLRFFEEMELKDLHLQGVANTRRKALTRLDWEVVSAAESQRFNGDKALADEAAAYVEEQLGKLESFEEAAEHLSQAIGPNLAVLELVWDGYTLEELVPVASHRLTCDPEDMSRVLVETAAHRGPNGIEARAPKFVVHTPAAKAGNRWTRSLSQAAAFIYCIKLLSITDWAVYMHRFGVPFIHGQYEGDVDEGTERKLKNMLANFGVAGYLLSSKAVSMSFVEAAQRGTVPQKELVEWCSRQESIGFLGQALTTDTTGETGTYAAASVHNMVRQDLLEDDIKAEGRTVRRQIVKPLCLYQYPGRDVPYPIFRRVMDEPTDSKLSAEVVGLAQQAGLKIPTDWAYEKLDIRKPDEGEETLTPSYDQFGQGLAETGD